MRSTRFVASALILVLAGCGWWRRVVLRCPGEYAYGRIVRLPYMGGSLLHDAAHPELSHLVPRARIPIRLGSLNEIRAQLPKPTAQEAQV